MNRKAYFFELPQQNETFNCGILRMRHLVATTSLILLLLCSQPCIADSSSFSAVYGCTIEQVVELAQKGLSSSEIRTECQRLKEAAIKKENDRRKQLAEKERRERYRLIKNRHAKITKAMKSEKCCRISPDWDVPEELKSGVINGEYIMIKGGMCQEDLREIPYVTDAVYNGENICLDSSDNEVNCNRAHHCFSKDGTRLNCSEIGDPDPDGDGYSTDDYTAEFLWKVKSGEYKIYLEQYASTIERAWVDCDFCEGKLEEVYTIQIRSVGSKEEAQSYPFRLKAVHKYWAKTDDGSPYPYKVTVNKYATKQSAIAALSSMKLPKGAFVSKFTNSDLHMIVDDDSDAAISGKLLEMLVPARQ